MLAPSPGNLDFAASENCRPSRTRRYLPFCLSVVGARLIVWHVRGLVLAALLLRLGTCVPVSIVKRNLQSFWKI